MANWQYSIGNLARRAAAAPAAVSPSVGDTVLPLTNLANDFPDLCASWTWRADGLYEADLDLNLLASSSERADAPTGWADLLLQLAGTPGLPANPPDWGTYGARTALRLYRPVVQDVEVMPGETVKLRCGIYWPAAAAGATGIRVRVVDLSNGKGWNGSAWAAGGVLDSQSVGDAWKEVDEQIDPDATRTERTTYRVIFEPIAAAYDATTYCYASANGGSGSPALIAEADLAAIVGHNLPGGATVTAGSIALVPGWLPSVYTVASPAPSITQTWRLSIQMPTGNQPRPVLGELWIGKARELLVGGPVLPAGAEESSRGQVSVESGRGRLEVMGEDGPYPSDLALEFKARTDAAWEQVRDGIMRLTRYGADPLLIVPSSGWEGTGRLYHGRVEARLAWSRVTPAGGETLRSFAMPFRESALAPR